MNTRNFFAELKRRNVYKVAVAYAVVSWLLIQIATQVFPFFESQTGPCASGALCWFSVFRWHWFCRGPSRSRRKESSVNRKSSLTKSRLIGGRKLIGITIAARGRGGRLLAFQLLRSRLMTERIPAASPAAPDAVISENSIAVLPFAGYVAGEGPGILLRRHLRGIAKFVGQDSAAQGAIADLVVFLQRQAGRNFGDRAATARGLRAGRFGEEERRPAPNHRTAHPRSRWLPPLVRDLRPQDG